ncbi:glycoside hydrolase family protein [Confluentibacter citreus]|uniref:hypothetical protein n=1 Tax=Confluentibacter citreus TaxID=2007307 RepID=UPI000C295130|nr:hypothetical protein [Confluentibacter citreus]
MKKISIALLVFITTVNQLKGQEISPYLFGQNMWLTDKAENRTGYIDQLWPKIKKSGIKIIRIGGNGFNRNMPDNETLLKWVTAIKSIGAEPLMQVSQHKSAEESAKLVAFFNSNEATKIKFWSIGNEPYHMAKMTVDSISSYIKVHASAMKAVDPTIKIHVPDLAAYYNEAYEALLLNDKNSLAGRDENGNWYVDGINFHNYPNAKDYSRSDVIFYSVSKMRGMILDLKEDLEAANKKYDRAGEDALIWGLTEFNITYDNPDDLSVSGIAVPSFINGQFWVDVFSMAMEHNAFTVTPWCIQESDRASTYFGYIGGPPEFLPHSTYYHMQMMAENMKGSYIKMKSSNPYLKVFGSKTDDDTTIIIMNQHETNSLNIDLNTINNQVNGTNDLTISATKNIKANYKLVSKPQSTILLKFDNSGNKTYQIMYDLEMAINNLPPTTINN